MKLEGIIVFSSMLLFNACCLTGPSKKQDFDQKSFTENLGEKKRNGYMLMGLRLDSTKAAIQFEQNKRLCFRCDPSVTDSDAPDYLLLDDGFATIFMDSSYMGFDMDYSHRLRYEGRFVNGRRIGRFRYIPIRDSKHRLVEVFDSLGLRHGYYTAYDTLGKRIHRGYFKHGTGYDKEFWYDTRGLRQKGRYVKGYKTGVWYYYDRHSKLRRKEYYKMGKLMKAVEVQQR